MSYLDHKIEPRQRIAAGVSVIAIQAVIGMVIVTGLTVAGVMKIDTERDPVTVFPTTPPPPEPSDPLPQPPDAATSVPKPTAPAPNFVLAQTPTHVDLFDPTDTVVDRVVPNLPDPGIAPRLPEILPSVDATAPRPKGNSSGWITTGDYPTMPLRNGIEGVAGYRLVIGTNGRVNACEVTKSSGNQQLDLATCKSLERRARFEPARDRSGNLVVGTFVGSVSWEIPE